MSEHFNQLTAAEDERLAILAEECAEVIQAVAKIQRHGWESRNPDKPADPTNRRELMKEIGDVFAAVHVLVNAGDVNYATIEAKRDGKLVKLKTWTHHQPHDLLAEVGR